MPSGKPVRRAAVMTHGKPHAIGPAFGRLQEVAARSGVELVLPPEEREKLGATDGEADLKDCDLAVVLGGDGTMLRALHRFLGAEVPVLGVNFGRVGFLSTMRGDELETGLERAFAGEFTVTELPTLECTAGGARHPAVNDVVATSATLGRMVELSWAIGDEDLGSLRCDGVIASTPSGSTAYNLSNGGPVLVWGLEAMAITFVAPHSLHARPLVVPRGRELRVVNRTSDVRARVLADGHAFADLGPDESAEIRVGDARTLLASLPEVTFFRRYGETFGS
jgi:NAD+ kinase